MGGAYTFGSANSTVGSPVLAANATGLRVISVNYTVAPFSKWNQTTDEVISVIQALIDQQGYSLEDDIAMFGDSAGGGLVAGSVLKMRDKGLGMPTAVVLWSPWLDLTGNGDTYFTLKNADPFLHMIHSWKMLLVLMLLLQIRRTHMFLQSTVTITKDILLL